MTTSVRSDCRFDAAQRAHLEDVVADLQELLRLRDWTVTVDWSQDSGTDAYALNDLYPSSKHAVLVLGDGLADLCDDEVLQVLVHELIHCHLHAIESLVGSALREVLGRDAHKVLFGAVRHEVEVATDHLADVLAPLSGVAVSLSSPRRRRVQMPGALLAPTEPATGMAAN